MKKLLTSILAVLTCFTCFAATACELPFGDKQPTSSEQPGTTSDLEGAKDALYSMYIVKDAETSKDYEVVNTTYYDGVYYNVSWSVDVTEGVVVKAGSEGMTLIDVDEYTLVDIPYVLTATISDADGKTASVSFERVVKSIVDPGALSAPVEGVAYYMYMDQLKAGSTYYVTGTMDGSYLATSANPADAAEVYVDAVDGGYLFYVLNGETKSYIQLTEYKKEDKTYWSASVAWAAEGTVFYYDPVGCWAAKLANDTFFIGTYNTFTTVSSSGSYYMTEDKIGTEQFPALLVLPENVAAVPATEKLAKEKENLSTTLEIYEAGDVTLATAGSDYVDVTISWVSGNTDYAVVDGGKVTYTLPTDADVTLTLTATLSVEGAESVTKEFTITVKKPGSSIPAVGVGYTLSSMTANGEIFFDGTLASGRINGTTTASSAVAVYFETTDVANEYYMYFMDGETKTYLYMAEDDSSGFAVSTTVPDDVWVIDLSAKTIMSKTTDRVISTQASSTFTNFSSYDKSNIGQSSNYGVYTAAWLKEAEGDDIGGGNGSGEVTPPTTGSIVIGTPYTLSAPTSKGTIYFNGTVGSGRINGTTTASSAVAIYFEATATANEYYIYFMNGETKTYLHGNAKATPSTSDFAFSTTVPSDVWVVNETAKTISSKATTRVIATQAGSTYTNFSTYAASNMGQSSDYGVYTPAWIEALAAHEHSYTSSVTAPTCTEAGYTTHTCACGHSYTDNTTNATGHSYQDVVTDPTCTVDGYTTHTCTNANCDYSYTDSEVPATGHSYQDGECSVCGAPDPNFEAHEHSYEEVVTAPTCTEAGYTTHTCACGHSYTDNTTNATGHSYQDVVTDPTCTVDGYTTHTCTNANCDYSYTDSEVPATGHNDTDGDYKCNNCSSAVEPEADSTLTIPQAIALAKALGTGKYSTNKYYLVVTIVDIYNTQYGNANVKDDDGNKYVIYGLYKDGTRYDALTEKPVAGDQLKVYAAVGSYNASTYQMKNAEIIEHVKHVHDYTPDVTEPTCTAAGYTTFTCVCGDSYKDEEVEATGHSYVEGTCSACGATEGGATVVEPKTVSVTMSSFGWGNSTNHKSFSIDENVTVSCTGGNNTGNYFTDGSSWRIYATDSPAGTVTISVPEGCELVSIKITCQTGTYAFLQYNGADVCNKTVEVSGSSVKLQSVKNGSNGKHVRIQAIEVTYKPAN